MKIYNKINLILIVLIIFLTPLILSTSAFKVDYLIYLLFIVEFFGFFIFKDERKKVINIISNILSNKILLSLLILNLAMYCSTIFAIDKRISLTYSIRFSMYIFIFYSIAYCISTKKNLNILIYSFFSSSIVITLGSIREILVFSSKGFQVSRNYRIASTLENSNNLGAFSLLTIFLAFTLFVNAKKSVNKIFLGLIVLMSTLNLVVCQSRNVLLGIGVGIFLLLLMYNKKFAILGILSPLLLFIPKIQLLVIKFLSLTPDSSRYRIWLTTKMMIQDFPLTGIGYENFATLYLPYVDCSKETLVTTEGYGWIASHPHNMLLKFQVETGILGSIALILFLVVTIIYLFNKTKVNSSELSRAISKGVFLSFTTFIALNIFDSYFNSLKVITALFILLGFAVCTNRLTEKNKKVG